jgi:hypothetical protein
LRRGPPSCDRDEPWLPVQSSWRSLRSLATRPLRRRARLLPCWLPRQPGRRAGLQRSQETIGGLSVSEDERYEHRRCRCAEQ